MVHHQSQEYNLTTALRQTSSSALFGWIFYLPMAIAGIPPGVFAVTAIVNLLYQYWIHTEQVGKLGWFDRWFSSPSNHRVHHAVNDRYIDRNYGGILMIWDRMFGSFVEETERCVYGTRAPLDSWDPLWANLEVYADLARKSWHAASWRDRLLVWLMPPGWQPATAAGAHWEKPHFDLAGLHRYDPPMLGGTRLFVVIQFCALLVGSTLLLSVRVVARHRGSGRVVGGDDRDAVDHRRGDAGTPARAGRTGDGGGARRPARRPWRPEAWFSGSASPATRPAPGDRPATRDCPLRSRPASDARSIQRSSADMANCSVMCHSAPSSAAAPSERLRPCPLVNVSPKLVSAKYTVRFSPAPA